MEWGDLWATACGQHVILQLGQWRCMGLYGSAGERQKEEVLERMCSPVIFTLPAVTQSPSPGLAPGPGNTRALVPGLVVWGSPGPFLRNPLAAKAGPRPTLASSALHSWAVKS